MLKEVIVARRLDFDYSIYRHFTNSLMNDSVLDRPIVLKLNKFWMRTGWATPRQAFISMAGGLDGGSPPAKGLSLTVDDNGELVEGIALDWDDWIRLPIRKCDFAISTGRGRVRVPSVIVSPLYEGMPVKRQRLTGKALRERDGGICQVSKRPLLPGEGNMGHIVARAKGGKRTWENIIYMDARLNTLQGTKTPEEMGWQIDQPRAPGAVPACVIPAEPASLDHVPFLSR